MDIANSDVQTSMHFPEVILTCSCYFLSYVTVLMVIIFVSDIVKKR